MALFRKFFYRKPPDGLLEITERVYVFDSCFTTDVFDDDKYRDYIRDIVAQLRSHFADASFMVFNFRDGDSQSLLANILSSYDMVVMDYPRQYEGCPLLTIEMIHHYLRSGESWLSLGQQNVLIMHCERGGWAVLAFMLAGLLLYRKQFIGEQRTLEMIYRQAPRELVQLLSPLNPMPSQIRYLHYISRRNVSSEWPPQDRALTLDCVILRNIPGFNEEGECRPIFRIYGQDPLLATSNTPKVLFATPKRSKYVRLYKKADCELIKIDIHCHIQGDVVLECISLDADQEREEMMFRVMFNTAFIRSNILMLNRDEIDILWDAKDRFPKEFRAEVLLSEMDTANQLGPMEVAGIGEKGGLPIEAFAKVQEMFSNVDWLDPTGDAAVQLFQRLTSSENIQLRQGFLSPSKKEAESLELGSMSPINRHSDNVEVQQEPSKVEDATVYVNKLESVGRQALILLEQATNSEVKTGISIVQENLGSLVHKVDSNAEQSISLEKAISSTMKSIEPVLKDQNAKLDEQHGSGQRSSPTIIMSQRFPISSSCSALSGYSSPRSLSACPRINSAPSAFGITALLEDHAGSAENCCGSTVTSTTVSNLCTGVIQITSKRPSGQHPTTGTPVVTKGMPPPPPLPSPLDLLVSDSIMMAEAKDSSQPTLNNSGLPSYPERRLAFQLFGTTTLATNHQKSSTSVTIELLQTSAPPTPPQPPSSSVSSSSSIYHMPPYSLSVTPTSFRPPGPAAPQPPPVPPPPPPVPRPSPVRSHAPQPLTPQRPASSLSLKLSEPPQSPPLPLPPGCSLSRPPAPPPPPLLASTSSTVTPAAPPLPLFASTLSPVRPAAPPPPPAPTLSHFRASAPPPPPPPGTTSSPPPPPPPRYSSKQSSSPMGKSMPSPPIPAPPSHGASGNIVPPPAPPGGNAKLFGPQGRGPAPPAGPMSKSFQSGQAVSRRSNLKPLHWVKVTRAMHGSLWAESQKPDETLKAPVFDMSELENLFSAVLPSSDSKRTDKSGSRASGSKPEKIHLIDLRRANNCGIMLTKVKMPLPDLMSAILALDHTVLDADQVENLIKFTPSKDEIELLKGYKGEKQVLGECEQFFMELMKVPRVESKLRVFSFKIQFRSQVSDLKRNLNIVNSSAEEIRGSVKLKRIMQTILSLGNALNQGTARGSAVGFRLDSLLKLSDTRARNNKMTLMHYLSKVLSEKLPELLDFPKDLSSLELAAKQIQLKSLAEEMQAVNKGLEKVEQELTTSENDGPVSEIFRKVTVTNLVDLGRIFPLVFV
ncbi:formin-like protein 6 isoform X3 [Sorghum bicolor]|uniref:formin-like protein 6 isoform X3 n=1 Tax=Sorghum bicolor TaxID=4558 RepID=UPI000B426C81|nr:formin-like protein 6 isoform X3 [Sorghum bicolor]|eukprot:XP_021320855.1 formin-like protein 6 isoform X3 [Sorghum bicolor]